MVYKYKLSKHSSYSINYHIVFCPKRRKSVLVDELKIELEYMITNICEEMNCKAESLVVQPDHVHLFISCPPTISPHEIVKNIKGITANKLRPKYSVLRKLPTMWSRSYYIGTVGHVSESVVKLYIENQKGK